MDVRKRQPIGIELVKRGVVTEENITMALQEQRANPDKKLGEILNDLNVCDSHVLIEAIGDIMGVKGIILSPGFIKLDILEYISMETARRNKVIPFDIENGKIKVCFSDTTNTRNIEAVRLLMLNKGLIIEPYITFGKILDDILKSLGGTASRDMSKIGQDDNITEIVDSIIKTAMEKRASDIHIEPGKDEVRVRYRIDGELFTATSIPKEKQTQIIGRMKAISNMHQEKQESQDGRILLYDDYNIRVSSQKNVYGEKFVLRLLKKNSNIKSIFELGYPGTEKELNKSINKKNSITVIAAPTGEGKTTTLYSFMDYLNKPEINITTIEDPVEIRIDGLNQIEVDAKSTFSGSLRTVLRQDPDIILVGEIRDKETAEIAIQSGQTGHYVLSTIHTIDAVEVITRLRKMGVPDYDIASTLATCISQRLVRKLCPHCRKEREFTEEEKEVITKLGQRYNIEYNLEGKKTYDAIGCSKCNNTGYYDRIGMFEILDITDDIKELIMNGASSIEIKKHALTGTYRPLCIDGINKVIAGMTNLEELNRKILLF
ncbi:MAG: Flp pilus assembly complex ATPase component TadA [Clostridia bacterium]|nr:Flp pilus assembly complex ATPase component TadA [Clostridia bacterium]